MDVSIIIVNWNTQEIISQCLHSIYTSQTAKKFEVWVVDNGSSDASVKMITESYPQVRLIANEKNVGFAHANNQAFMQSSGENVMLLNPDTVVEKDVIENLVNFLDQTPDVGAVGPRLLNPDGTLQESAYPEPTLLREFWRMFHLDRFYYFAEYPMDQWSVGKDREVDVLMGACMLIRRKALDQVGFLDEEFFIYSEEVDLCTRIRNYGWRLFWIPSVKVIHYGGQSTQQVQQEMFVHLYQGKILYFRKHCSPLTVWLYKIVLFMATLARLALTPIAYFEHSSKKREHLDLSSNYRRLLWSLPNL
ncbi:MAG: glycosyltransferase family 2 protein [Anaerolineales bacterium]|nr:glycosyltransferase family 2 protein [Anaerolineales bacterium]